MFAKSGPKPIIHVLKAWSKVPPDLQRINPEWVLRQLRCVTGSGSSRFSWKHPKTGDVADVRVEPLPEKYRPLAVLLYKMDPHPQPGHGRGRGQQAGYRRRRGQVRQAQGVDDQVGRFF